MPTIESWRMDRRREVYADCPLETVLSTFLRLILSSNFNLFQISVIMLMIQGLRIILEIFECHRITGNDVTIFFPLFFPKYSGSHLLLSVLRSYGHVFRSTRFIARYENTKKKKKKRKKMHITKKPLTASHCAWQRFSCQCVQCKEKCLIHMAILFSSNVSVFNRNSIRISMWSYNCWCYSLGRFESRFVIKTHFY